MKLMILKLLREAGGHALVLIWLNYIEEMVLDK